MHRRWLIWGAILAGGMGACAHRGAAPPAPTVDRNQAARDAGVYALPAAGAQGLVVRLVNPVGTMALELSCGPETRLRAPLITDGVRSLGIARFDAIPAEGCTLYFKGGPPAEWRPVMPGSSLDCRLSATTAVCAQGVVGSMPTY